MRRDSSWHTGRAFITLMLSLSWCGMAAAVEQVTPGELITERPTLRSLGFEWRVTGDANRNAFATINWRKAGDEAWRDHLPLYRSGGGATGTMGRIDKNIEGDLLSYEIPNCVSGSVLNLEPDTVYEIRLELKDPDGVEGEAVQNVSLKTRAVPERPSGGEIRHVYPEDYKGEKEAPAYSSIMHAVNGFNPIWDNFQTLHYNSAPPGTIVLLHGGTYQIDLQHYREPVHQRWLTGEIFLTANGQPDAPVAIVAAGDGEVIIDGNGAHTLFNVRSADYLYFEGLTIRNTNIAFFAGYQGERGGGAKGLTIRNCWIENVVYGVLAEDGRSEDFYIADNVILGRNPGDRFNPESGGAYGRTEAGYAVNLSGAGHVIENNYAANFWDGMNVFTNALPDPAFGQQARAIDFHNNVIFNSTDNHLETDGGYANIRVQRNWMINVMSPDTSTQPNYVGPTYYIRNIFWNGRGGSALKPDGRAPVLIFLHNTMTSGMVFPKVGTVDMRNNLFLAPAEKSTDKHTRIASLPEASPHRTIDYNAYREGMAGNVFKIGRDSFGKLEEVKAQTEVEAHGVSVPDYSVVNAPEPPYAISNYSPLVSIIGLDPSPSQNSPLIDAAAVIPAINEDYAGAGPDIGAIEKGQKTSLPGPRPAEIRARLIQHIEALELSHPAGD